MISFRTDIASMRALSLVHITQRGESGALKRLATGDRLHQAATDAAGSGVASELRARRYSLRMAMHNSEHGLSLISVAEGGMHQIADNLKRMRELAVQSSSDTLSDSQRGYLDVEFVARADEITRIAQTTEWSGINLLDTAGLTYDVQVGIDGTADSRITVTLGDLRASGASMGVDAGSTDVLTAAAARTAIGDVDQALDYVNGLRSGVGASQNRIMAAYRIADGMRLDAHRAEGRIRDIDVMHEMALLVKSRLTSDAAMSFVLQARNMSHTATHLLD